MPQARIKKLEDGARLEQEDRISREKNRKMQAEEADRLELENSLVRDAAEGTAENARNALQLLIAPSNRRNNPQNVVEDSLTAELGGQGCARRQFVSVVVSVSYTWAS